MDISPLVAIIPVILAAALIITIVRRNIMERRPGEPIDIAGAIPAFVILMVAVILIGGMAESVEEREYELYDCVPLSSFGSGATIEGDCAEIVNIGDIEYVRMTNLGTFTVTVNGSEKDYNVSKAHMDLVLLTGQSNSVYFTSPQYYEEDSPVAPGKAFYLGQEQGSGTDAGLATSTTLDVSGIVDLVDSDGGVRVAQMYPAFCSGYVSETGHRVLVVNTGKGGMSINNWMEGNPCDVWMEDVFDRLADLVSDGSVVLTPTVALWSQGEADADKTYGFYEYRLNKLLQKLNDGGYGYAFKDVLSVLPRHPNYDSPIIPASVQMDVAEENPHFVIASTLPLIFTSDQMRPDTVHYTQETFGWLGEAFARSAASVMRYTPETETIVMAATGESVASLPSKMDAYGTSGQAYELSVAWTATEDYGTYSGALSGNPTGTVMLDGLTASASIWTWDLSTGKLGIYRDVPQTEDYPWDSYAGSVEGILIAEGVRSVASDAFTLLTGVSYMSVPTTLTASSTSFGVAFKDYAGSPMSELTAGEYAGVGDGEVYLCDDSIYAYDEGIITGLSESASDAVYLVIPAEHGGVDVTDLAVNAFRDNTAIAKAVVLPDSNLKSVGTGAFIGCTSLTDAELGDLTYFGSAFYGCTSLKSFVVSDGIDAILANSFYGCSSMTSVTIPDSVTSFGSACFRDCGGLTSVNIPDGTTVISDRAFYGCNHVTSFSFSDSITSIGDLAFRGCSGVTSVSFEEGFDATLSTSWAQAWTFYDTDSTTVLDRNVASNLAGHTFTGTASALVKQA